METLVNTSWTPSCSRSKKTRYPRTLTHFNRLSQFHSTRDSYLISHGAMNELLWAGLAASNNFYFFRFSFRRKKEKHRSNSHFFVAGKYHQKISVEGAVLRPDKHLARAYKIRVPVSSNLFCPHYLLNIQKTHRCCEFQHSHFHGLIRFSFFESAVWRLLYRTLCHWVKFCSQCRKRKMNVIKPNKVSCSNNETSHKICN